MAFQDNSGDIIFDVVLTDEGRKRLAKGDGSFNIAQFALGDDEINYSQYDVDHPSGSAYSDLEILQTPVFEQTVHLNKQGIASFFRYDYPDYSLELNLKKLNLTPLDCKR